MSNIALLTPAEMTAMYTRVLGVMELHEDAFRTSTAPANLELFYGMFSQYEVALGCVAEYLENRTDKPEPDEDDSVHAKFLFSTNVLVHNRTCIIGFISLYKPALDAYLENEAAA